MSPRSSVHRTKKHIGWARMKPGYHQRTVMYRRCGKKCFLGPKKSYPICRKNTCEVSPKGVYAAYIRANQYHKRKITAKARKLLVRI